MIISIPNIDLHHNWRYDSSSFAHTVLYRTALIAGGETLDSPCITNAMGFLLSKQNANGGWGESYLACVNKAYPLDGTGPVRIHFTHYAQ